MCCATLADPRVSEAVQQQNGSTIYVIWKTQCCKQSRPAASSSVWGCCLIRYLPRAACLEEQREVLTQLPCLHVCTCLLVSMLCCPNFNWRVWAEPRARACVVCRCCSRVHRYFLPSVCNSGSAHVAATNLVGLSLLFSPRVAPTGSTLCYYDCRSCTQHRCLCFSFQ